MKHFNGGGHVFQSTLPVWGATSTKTKASNGMTIMSIHAPRVGSDHPKGRVLAGCWHFNPRSPCGERLVPPEVIDHQRAISIHAPRVGSDQCRQEESRRNKSISLHAPRVGRVFFA